MKESNKEPVWLILTATSVVFAVLGFYFGNYYYGSNIFYESLLVFLIFGGGIVFVTCLAHWPTYFYRNKGNALLDIKLSLKNIYKFWWFRIIVIVIVLVAIFGGILIYRDFSHRTLLARQQKEGWVTSLTWDCPDNHPIKGNLNSHIYHTKSSPYYEKTNARNCECFDTAEHAKAQGFRAPLK